MLVQPYLNFDGRCEEALEFYAKALGAKVTMMMRYRESPEQPGMNPAGAENKIMHSNFSIGDTQVMASDGHCEGKKKFEGFSLTLGVATAAEAERCFSALADGGQVFMPLAKTFWSPCFGMVGDRFGLMWMVSVPPAEGHV